MSFIAVVSMVRNEADVIESFVRHNLGWADRLYVAVHESSDETLSILQALQGDGLPIVLSEVKGAAQLQSEVVTMLMRQAVAEGAAFVVPLDADEFLLPDGGSNPSQSLGNFCRTIFTSMDEGKVYAAAWVRYVPKSGQGFLLSRRAHREKWPEKLTKIILGAEAVRAAELEISQGNHLVLLPGLEGERQKVVPEALKGVHIAHYPWRSEEQAAKKAAVGWLGNVAKYTRYTRIANQWRDGYRELMKGRSLQPEPLRHPVKAPRLPGSEVVRLCYTPDYDRENLLELVMRAAEQMAEECAEFRARLLRQTVSLLMLYKGHTELFAKTLASALADDYPAKEYIVLAPEVSPEDEAALVELLEQQPVESISLLSGPTAWSLLPESLKGEFVQWLPEGFVMQPDRLIKMVSALSAQEELSLMLAAVEEGEYLDDKIMRQEVFDIDMGKEIFMPGDGSQAAQSIWDANQCFPGGLASAIFRKRQLEALQWPPAKDWQEGEGKELLASLLAGHAYGYIAEPLLKVEISR